ncbi:hypothetical protein ATEIFO6365_0001040700 [Aspergillus terreus]|uniref:Uncharacterized protein n=1 Tax=Aspergillus terreus TaxID=33178 RepID=A0A5M3YLD7_ASPTE|nr:hypothetical protein ATETN484_0001032800 [Aspergillus terreus]GFF12184.1 hypothetical protein ATEIFO6365_0001040700 [Aspergillus terreus]
MVGPRMHAHGRTYHRLIRRAATTTEDEGMYAGRSLKATRVHFRISYRRNAGGPKAEGASLSPLPHSRPFDPASPYFTGDPSWLTLGRFTARIVAVMQLSTKVARYVRDVTDATGYRNTLLLEMGATKGILDLPWDVGQSATQDADTMANAWMLEEPLKNYAALSTWLEGVLTPAKGLRKVGNR